MDTVFALLDVVGHEGIEKLEETLAGFNQWRSLKIDPIEGKNPSCHSSPEKRTHAYMSHESYKGSTKGIYTTHHM